MKLKPGVSLKGLVPQMAIAAIVVNGICADFGIECVITSGNDSKHGPDSLHSRGGLCRAFDVRTKYNNLNGRETEFRDALKEALGGEFDVVIEAIGTDNEHAHIEWDPK